MLQSPSSAGSQHPPRQVGNMLRLQQRPHARRRRLQRHPRPALGCAPQRRVRPHSVGHGRRIHGRTHPRRRSLQQGPGRHRSPRYRLPQSSRNQGTKCVERHGELYLPGSTSKAERARSPGERRRVAYPSIVLDTSWALMSGARRTSAASSKGLTLVRFSASREHMLRDRWGSFSGFQ
jgi:hypothetical protein